MTLAEAMSELSDVPAEAKITTTPGWPSAGSWNLPELGSVPTVRIGQRQWPARFSVGIKSSVESAPFACVLLFEFPEQERRVVYAGGWAITGEWDAAEKWVFSLRSKSWWKRFSFVGAAEEMWAHEVNERFGAEPSWSKADANQIFDELQTVIRDGVSVATTRRRDRITDEVLIEVARVYREAWAAGLNPTKTVEKHFHKSPATASRWVSLSRRAGHLGPSDSTRGGEALPSAAGLGVDVEHLAGFSDRMHDV